MQLFKSTVGRKVLMAITGQLMVLFVVVHLLGNSSIFVGPNGINAYAEHLHSLGPLVWIFRLVMLVLLLVHGIYGVIVTLENNAASPAKYGVYKKLSVNFAGNNMIWTGLLLLAFIVYHLLHFTARVTPGMTLQNDLQGRFDVFSMVVSSFQHGTIALIYIVSMVVLFLHLFHGIQSFFQTMGWNNDRSRPVISTVGRVVALVFLLGYSSIPVVILTRILT